jgi:hypothetical protein
VHLVGFYSILCWVTEKHWNNKFYYTVASCWFFLWVWYYDAARIHEHQVLRQVACSSPLPRLQLTVDIKFHEYHHTARTHSHPIPPANLHKSSGSRNAETPAFSARVGGFVSSFLAASPTFYVGKVEENLHAILVLVSDREADSFCNSVGPRQSDLHLPRTKSTAGSRQSIPYDRPNREHTRIWEYSAAVWTTAECDQNTHSQSSSKCISTPQSMSLSNRYLSLSYYTQRVADPGSRAV